MNQLARMHKHLKHIMTIGEFPVAKYELHTGVTITVHDAIKKRSA